MNFLQPFYLWGLLGLAIPLAIHLLSRKEGRTIRLGSLRHVRETSSRQFRSVRINELVLLALRSIVVALAVGLMSDWYMEGVRDHRKWLLVESGLEHDSGLKPLVDSLAVAGFESRFLAPGFPELDGDGLVSEPPDYIGRMEELESYALDSVVVASRSLAVGFRGSRIALPSHIRWITLGSASGEFEVRKIRIHNDSTFVRVGRSSATGTSYMNIGKGLNLPSTDPRILPGMDRDTLRVAVTFDQGFETDYNIIMASLEAIQNEAPELVLMDTIQPSQSKGNKDWLIWLSQRPVPNVKSHILRFADQPGSSLLIKVKENEFVLTRRLNSETATTGNLAVHMMSMLFPSVESVKLASKWDARELNEHAMWSAGPGSTDRILPVGNAASSRYLLGTLVLFLVAERLVSYWRKQ